MREYKRTVRKREREYEEDEKSMRLGREVVSM